MKVFPGGRIGILGDGQLGRMLALEARRMGYRVVVLGPDRRGSAGQVADRFVAGALDCRDAALRVASATDVVTVETEHVPAAVLSAVAQVRPLHPGAAVLETIQDRLRQKTFFARQGFPQAPFAPAGSLDELREAAGSVALPAVLKARAAGYDGKGQARIGTPGELPAAFAAIGREPAVLEAYVPFRQEISVILARTAEGEVRCYPIAENEHRNHVLHITRVPARIDEQTARRAQALAVSIAEALGHVGVMAVELFLLEDGTLLVNEVAPRVHNSGHYTFGGCVTSQFEQHIRAICGLTLGETALLRPTAMVNLLGDAWLDRPAFLHEIVRHPEVRLHLYGKHPPARGRKMGHVLVLAATAEKAADRAESIAAACAAQTGLAPAYFMQ